VFLYINLHNLVFFTYLQSGFVVVRNRNNTMPEHAQNELHTFTVETFKETTICDVCKKLLRCVGFNFPCNIFSVLSLRVIESLARCVPLMLLLYAGLQGLK